MSQKEVYEWIELEFSELAYANYTPIGCTNSIIVDQTEYFEDQQDSDEYRHLLTALLLLNIEHLAWYKEHRADFLNTALLTPLTPLIRSEQTELNKLVSQIKQYLSNQTNDVTSCEKTANNIRNQMN